MFDKAGWSRTVSPDSWFVGVTVDSALELADDVCTRPDKYAKSMISAAYRALVHHGICTEAEAFKGVAEVAKLRTRLMREAKN